MRLRMPFGRRPKEFPSNLWTQCPDCGEIMHRRNYAGASGVIIDFCKNHGVWFDADELPRLLAWIRSGVRGQVGVSAR